MKKILVSHMPVLFLTTLWVFGHPACSNTSDTSRHANNSDEYNGNPNVSDNNEYVNVDNATEIGNGTDVNNINGEEDVTDVVNGTDMSNDTGVDNGIGAENSTDEPDNNKGTESRDSDSVDAAEDGDSEVVGNNEDSDIGQSDIEDNGNDDDDDDVENCEPIDLENGLEIEECTKTAPPDSFDPVEEWRWTPATSNKKGLGPPLVMNMTDDNNDGIIDMCDMPDVIVVAGGEDMNVLGLPGVYVSMPQIYVLDGATGTLHYTIDIPVSPYTTPAVGDIDGDGLPEIVVTANLASILENIFDPTEWQGLLAFEHDGTLKWSTDIGTKLLDIAGSIAITLADLDNDGSVEVVSGAGVYDGATGEQIWSQTNNILLKLDGLSMASIAADLDGDGRLEVITGTYAFTSDGDIYYDRSELVTPSTASLIDFIIGIDDLIGLYPVVADLDDDPNPEIVVAGGRGIFILEHDGEIKHVFDPNDEEETLFNFELSGGEFGPAVIHDFTGDGKSEIGIGTTVGFVCFDRWLEPIWSTPISGKTITQGATAFDFLGDGVAEVIYSDSKEMLVFDGATGEQFMSWPRIAANDYPIVADVDNDGSAEIIFVNKQPESGEVYPTLQVIGDAENRWIPTRRVWNQHSYHVTNVSENGVIPRDEMSNWELINTFRTNVQMEEKICDPEILVI